MNPRFLLDGMLGRLCRKMRMLGLDTELAKAGRSAWFLTDAENAGRTAVTTATRLLDRHGPPPVVLRSSGAAEMIAELFEKTGQAPEFTPFTLCLECNVLLTEVPAEKISGCVPPRILQDFNEFHECPECGRAYWRGSHYDAMAGQVERIMRRVK